MKLAPLDYFSEALLPASDALLVDLEGALAAWLEGGVWESKPDRVLSADAHRTLVDTLQRRSRELRRFIDEGRPAVLFPAVLPALKYVDKKGRWSDVEGLEDLYPALASPAPAGTLEFRDPLTSFGERLRPHFRPHAVLPRFIGSPAFLLQDKVAGAFLCDDKRWVLTSPRVADEGRGELAAAFAELYQATSVEARIPDLPEWHDRYRLPGEAEMAMLLEQIDKAIAEVTALRAQKLAEKNELGYLKRLFTDEGPSLRRAVAVALQAMGFDVQPGGRGRDELVATLGKATAVVVTKGKSKAASEADAVELEKAVHRHFKATDAMPKGILVVNGFGNLPLHERTEPVFPAAMHGFARNRGQCLITGLQLLCLFYEARHPERAARVRTELMDAVGPFPRFAGDEWQAIFTPAEPPKQSG